MEGVVQGQAFLRGSEGEKIPFEEWHLRVAVLASLLLQVVLLVSATFRKRIADGGFHIFVHTIYWLSKKAAYTAWGLIVGVKMFALHKMPFGLWAAIMMLHLAGQERLSVYSLEDNVQWYQSSIKLIVLYLLHLSFNPPLYLSLPTWIIVSLAFVRLFLRALRLSLGAPVKNGFQLIPNPHPFSVLHTPTTLDGFNSNAASATNMETLLEAHYLLRSSLRLIDGSQDGFRQNQSDFFRQITDSTYAIRIAEIELNFVYESFYTDGTIRKHLHDGYSILYLFLSCFAFFACLIALITFVYLYERDNFSGTDYTISFILLWGTFILELFSYILTVFSDWSIAALKSKYYGNVLLAVVPHRRRWWSGAYSATNTLEFFWYGVARIMFRRWSETVPKFSFVEFSMKRSPEIFNSDIINALAGTTGEVRKLQFVTKDWYSDSLGKFIFDNLKTKEPTDSALRSNGLWAGPLLKRSVLVWHLVTELLFHSDEPALNEEHRQHSKLLSDYMAYLLFMDPLIMPRLMGNLLDDIDAAWHIIYNRAPMHGGGINFRAILSENFNERIMSEAVSEANTLRPRTPVEGVSWNVICDKWVELLLYAAGNCDPIQHVKALSKGGELVTFVWILAFHLGLLQPGNLQESA